MHPCYFWLLNGNDNSGPCTLFIINLSTEELWILYLIGGVFKTGIIN